MTQQFSRLRKQSVVVVSNSFQQPGQLNCLVLFIHSFQCALLRALKHVLQVNNQRSNFVSFSESSNRALLSGLAGLLITVGFSLTATAEISTTIIGTDQNALFGVDDNVRDFLSANRGSNGGGDQSQQAGDAPSGSEEADLLIGALGIDVMSGNGGNNILIGGTEDFNPFNRDRAFGGTGDDVFMWAPGDGNIFFDGGEGNAVGSARIYSTTDPMMELTAY